MYLYTSDTYLEPYIDFDTSNRDSVSEVVDFIDDIKDKITDQQYVRMMKCTHMNIMKSDRRIAGTRSDPVYYSSLRVKIRTSPDKVEDYDIMDFQERANKIILDVA